MCYCKYYMAVYADSHTKNNVGIICDLCGNVSRDKFKYYSAKIDLIEVDRAVGKSGILNVDRRFLDVDLCESCMEDLKKKMLVVIDKREHQGTWTATVAKG